MGFICDFANPDYTLKPNEHREALVASMIAVGWSLNPSSVSLDVKFVKQGPCLVSISRQQTQNLCHVFNTFTSTHIQQYMTLCN